MKYWLIIATLISVVFGCSYNRNRISDHSISEIYESAQKKLQDGHYKMAVKELEELDKSYPLSVYAPQVQLNLIYAYYKMSDFPLAKDSIDRFLRLNPTHPNVDYALYMSGLTDMELDTNELQEFLGIDRSDRNPEHARSAFHIFMQLIRTYPNSQYSMDAHKRLIYLKNRLAIYELSIVKYYNERGAYVAVVNRVEQMLRNFPDTQATYAALSYMKRAYQKLRLNEQAEKVKNIIQANRY